MKKKKLKPNEPNYKFHWIRILAFKKKHVRKAHMLPSLLQNTLVTRPSC